jgi:ribosomal protein S18 acetylase RimI-like enzyme
MREGPIRVWLEPGHDRGRYGCWMLDWPGCFCWGPTRAEALARVPSAVGGFIDWLAEHGDAVAEPGSDEVEIVEEVAAEQEAGYERNALFAADDRDVSAEGVEATIRRLGHARDDLQRLAERVTSFERDHGPLETTGGEREERTADAVLRHLAGSEVWLAGRLDRAARYAGAPRDGELVPFMDETRGWAIDQLRTLQARDPRSRGVDGKGEGWTLAKVVRRLLYHSLDHLEELDRRLAVASGAAGRVELRRDAPPLDDLIGLFRASGFRRRIGQRERVERMLAGSTETVSAWDAERLVGFGRSISDGAFNAYVSTVAVHPRWQRRGLGSRIMDALTDGHDELTFVLMARPGAERFYRELGFEQSPMAMARHRRR